MLHLIQGNSDAVFKAFGCDFIVTAGSSSHDVSIDIERVFFFGTADDCQYHIDTWQNNVKSNHTHFAQGNMSAGNLFYLFGTYPFLMMNNDEDESPQIIHYHNNRVNIGFAFVNNAKQLCGLSLYYLNNDPSKWMIGLVKNTNLAPSEREVFVLSRVDPEPYLKKEMPVSIKPVAINDNQLQTAINEPHLMSYVEQIINSDGDINILADEIKTYLQIVRPCSEFKPNKALLDTMDSDISSILPNKALQILKKLQLNTSAEQRMECRNTSSSLYQSICSLFLQHEPLTKNTPGSKLFFQAVCEVESTCLEIKKRLLKESVKKYHASQPFEDNYRHAMYELLYEQIMNPNPLDKTSFCERIKTIEEPWLQALDAETHPWLRRTLMLLVNTLTILFTFGILNVWHQATTGDFLFFSRPSYAETLEKLDLRIINNNEIPGR